MKKLESMDDFKQFLDGAGDKLVVIDFSAEWCGPCKQISPKFKKYAEEFPDVLFANVDVDENDEVAEDQGISAMPTFKFYRNGKKVADMTGADAVKLKNMIMELKN